jgi:hypothetical protein
MRVAAMSMYCELLEMSLSIDEDAAAAVVSERGLLDELAASRDRLTTGEVAFSGRSGDAPSRIASEIRYDRALIRLCRLHDIPCDVARFARPSGERRRLEHALEATGVELKSGRLREPRRGGRNYEPPEGS